MLFSRPTSGGSRRRVTTAIAGLAVASLALTACGSSSGDDASGKATKDATVVFGSSAITNTLDPHAVLSSSGRSYSKQVFDTLLTFDADGNLEPGLATEWNRIDDTSIEFKLREGVTFHAGGAFTGDAVKKNVERVTSGDPQFGTMAGRLASIEGVEVKDDTTIVITTKDPDPILLNRLTLFDIIDPASFDKAAEEPSGTGPFQLTEYKPADSITLDRFDASWRATENVKTVTLKQIADPATLVSALKTDAIDIAFGLPSDMAIQLEGAGFENTTRSAGSAAINSLVADAEPKLADVRVRKAINLAINREEFVDAALGGFGKPNGSQLLQEGYIGFDEDLESYDYDPEEAKKLIKEAGVEGLELPIATAPLFKSQAEAVAGYLNAVGFKSEVVIEEFSAFVGTLLQKSKYPLLYWQTDYFDLRDISSVVRLGPQGGKAQEHIDNAEYQKLFVAQGKEMDADKREDLIEDMAETLNENADVLFLAWPENVYTAGKDLGDLPLGGDSLVRFEKLVVTE
ncbi:ABC transporter substrate-binding protein [Nocardioides yefusunii]|uniref:ABC transporter substrate-binding protein n=1 Tax=Nocardioides yefusunii TaxID=2500546 RepID=A0ABW1R103_9ACTN|nr:ABC transporter substrate-binding protein [Nocardioides yefusunii]